MRGKVEEIDSHKVVLNYIKRKGASLPSVFTNTSRCHACGKVTFVNTFGFCEKCWKDFSYLKSGKIKNAK